ncbi:hypothetical protein Scep_029621 [Stephania cephalantha]|uniref:Uncharacterized protein n=1 Tax=Stephania cephalantha TaxID=152367 RepID=A0AAP0E103_9MAGN
MSYNISLCKTRSLRKNDEWDNMNMIPYALAMKIITYVILCIQLDMPYALKKTYIYLIDYSEGHWIFIDNILKYFRSTREMLLDL